MIVAEEAIAKGIRRIVAVTGAEAQKVRSGRVGPARQVTAIPPPPYGARHRGQPEFVASDPRKV